MVDLKKYFYLFRKKKAPLKFVYSKSYWMVDWEDHVFPLHKYRLIYETLLRIGVAKENFLIPEPAKEEDILLVHSSKYIKKLKTGKLSQAEILALELPYIPEFLDFFLLQTGGSILAAEYALSDGLAIHIGGGFHHAFQDHGEGFCVLNDVAITLEKLRQEGRIEKAMVVDCDVHQGNGTAVIFSKKSYAFTFSIHQMDLYPAKKPSGSRDVGLWSGDGDNKYLDALRSVLPGLYEEFQPDLVLFLAGADPFEKDQLGGLMLTKEGLVERDRVVIDGARNLGLPVAVFFAGGYAPDVLETVSIHLNTIQVAKKAQKKFF